MNSAPAELLQPLTSAALQPSIRTPSGGRRGVQIQILLRRLRVVGRVLSSMDLRRSQSAFSFSKKKPPSLNRIRQDG
jgi:hypothetical protein